MHKLKHTCMRFGLLLLVAIAACENNPDEVAAYTRKVQEVEEGHQIKAIFSQSANLKAELSAPLMYRVKADTPYTEFPKNLQVNFFDEKAVLQSVVQAKYGKYFDLMNKVYLRDSVVVYNTTGDTLYCHDLWWDQAQAIFYTDDSVRINTKTQKLKGTGFWSKADFSKYTIRNPVGLIDVPQNIQP